MCDLLRCYVCVISLSSHRCPPRSAVPRAGLPSQHPQAGAQPWWPVAGRLALSRSGPWPASWLGSQHRFLPGQQPRQHHTLGHGRGARAHFHGFRGLSAGAHGCFSGARLGQSRLPAAPTGSAHAAASGAVPPCPDLLPSAGPQRSLPPKQPLLSAPLSSPGVGCQGSRPPTCSGLTREDLLGLSVLSKVLQYFIH